MPEVPPSPAPAGHLTPPGAVLLVSCYELGRQPFGLAWPRAFLRRAGFAPECLDVSVDGFDLAKTSRARFVAISAPMHTALRLGVRVARRIRRLNPSAHICFHGLYAFLNAEFLLREAADSVIAGEVEEALVSWIETLNGNRTGAVEGVRTRAADAMPVVRRLSFPSASRDALPPLERYAHLHTGGDSAAAGVVEASRGCLHLGPLLEESFTFAWTHPDPRMDRLHEAVSAAVEQAARAGEDDEEVFDRIRGLGVEAAGRPSSGGAPRPARPGPAPRLTEPWFC